MIARHPLISSCLQSGALSLVEIYRDTVLWLVPITVLPRQLSYAKKSQLNISCLSLCLHGIRAAMRMLPSTYRPLLAKRVQAYSTVSGPAWSEFSTVFSPEYLHPNTLHWIRLSAPWLLQVADQAWNKETSQHQQSSQSQEINIAAIAGFHWNWISASCIHTFNFSFRDSYFLFLPRGENLRNCLNWPWCLFRERLVMKRTAPVFSLVTSY